MITSACARVCVCMCVSYSMARSEKTTMSHRLWQQCSGGIVWILYGYCMGGTYRHIDFGAPSSMMLHHVDVFR